MTATHTPPTTPPPAPKPKPKRSATLRWTIIGAVAAVVGVVIAGVALFGGEDKPDQGCGDITITSAIETGVACTNGDGSKVQIGDVNNEFNSVVNENPDAVAETELMKLVTEYADVNPVGDGPWPFRVADDGGIGLKVRTNPFVDGVHIGGLAHLHTAWVDCVVSDSGFDPDIPTGNGARWYRLRWNQQNPDTGFHESEPGATGIGYSYGGYLFPVGHNGHVPECPTPG